MVSRPRTARRPASGSGLLLDGNLDDEQRACTKAELLAYCRLDTLAMVHLLRRLRRLAAA